MARSKKARVGASQPDTAKPEASYHHGDLRTALIAAARHILETEGREALSLRAAARAAGVSQAAPYHHFAGKDALLAAIAARGFDELTEAMTKRMAKETEPTARLNASGVGYVAFAVNNPELFTLMFGGVTQHSSGDAARGEAAMLREAGGRAYGVLQSAIMDFQQAKGGAAEDVPLAGLWSWCGVHGLAKLVIEQKLDPKRYGVTSAEALAATMLARVNPS
jgi:AcrR family transcriptional regulator